MKALAVRTSTIEIRDAHRHRLFPCEIWQPERGGRAPLILFSHAALQGRRSATFLCDHLASHGYVVAALDHSEVIAPELARRDGESDEEKRTRWQAVIDSRVPDMRLLLDHLLASGLDVDREAIGIAGHSFGGWTALAALESDDRFRAVVALAPAGASNPPPGILPATLTFAWQRDVPALYIVAENDTSLPLAGMFELFRRTPSTTKRIVVLERADHMHFLDDAAKRHEAARTGPAPSPELAAMQRAMLPMAQLQSEDDAHRTIRDLTLAHFDATLRQNAGAAAILDRAARNVA